MMNRWSFEEEKRFQIALLCYPEDYPNRWENIAQVVGSSKEKVFQRHQNLQIELGLVQPPKRNRRPLWTLEEHTLFLLGVQKYGKGHWNNISRYAVVTRDVAQVTSHAQKFYIRQEERETREHRRRSIHDVSLENSDPEYLNHLLSLHPHLVLNSYSIMQQYHQATLPIDYDLQLNQLSTQMNQACPRVSTCVQLHDAHYSLNSQVGHQSMSWNQGDQYESQFLYLSPTHPSAQQNS